MPRMIDLDAPPEEVYAQLVGVSDAGFEKLMGEPETRQRVIDTLIEHMAQRLRPEQATAVDAVIHVKLWDRPGGGYDHRELIIREGRCIANDPPTEEPRMTLKIRPADLRAMVVGATGPRRLAFNRRLGVVGDVRLAWKLPDLFDLSVDP
jgi:hypothetical protein